MLSPNPEYSASNQSGSGPASSGDWRFFAVLLERSVAFRLPLRPLMETYPQVAKADIPPSCP
jgi:hypothetical protein